MFLAKRFFCQQRQAIRYTRECNLHLTQSNIEKINKCGEREGWIIQKASEDKGYGVYALKSFEANDLVTSSELVGFAETRDKYSMQWDDSTHIHVSAPGRTFNHCCFPNLGIRNNYNTESYDFYAIQPIQAGDELRWNYETTEYISICIVGEAQCQNKQCRKHITGFKYNKDFILSTIGVYVADYLKTK